MKIQIQRFPVHQNAKVFAVLMAVSSLVFLVPFALVMSFTGPKATGPSMFMVLLFPIIYLVMGYVMIAISCWVYNVMAKHIGGLEFESRDVGE